MFRRASHHGRNRTRPRPAGAALATRLFALALIGAIGFAQFATSWHETAVRHVRCAEHGEVTDVALGSDHDVAPARASVPRIKQGPTGATSEHDHCAVAFALRGSAQPRVLRVAERFAPPPVVVRCSGAPAPRPGRAFVLASAPKTSPPVA
jgi:hypothetical protein